MKAPGGTTLKTLIEIFGWPSVQRARLYLRTPRQKMGLARLGLREGNAGRSTRLLCTDLTAFRLVLRNVTVITLVALTFGQMPFASIVPTKNALLWLA